jgi:hypothetical protein
MIFAYPLSDSDMQCHLAPALLGWGVGKYIAASTSHISARAWCRIGSGPVHIPLFASVNMIPQSISPSQRDYHFSPVSRPWPTQVTGICRTR